MRAHNILVVDDGELGDIRALLADLGTEYIWVRGDALDGVPFPMPSRLLIATPRQALRAPPREPGETTPMRIAILTDDASTLRARLVDGGFDYLIRRPVHPVALRLLVLRLLYRGEEKRAAERVPIGCPATVRRLLRWQPALLADVSARGCRLLLPRSVKPDTPLTLRLPREVTQDRELRLAGWVVRCERDLHASPELPFAAALVFALLPAEVDQRLQALIARAALGPLTIEPQEEPMGSAIRPASPSRLAAEEPRVRLRRSLRRPFSGRVVAIQQHDRAMRVLVGRDLSVEGMLVEPHPGLQCGDRLSLAFYGSPEQRLVVEAEVVREEREGLALRFLNAGPELTSRLEAMIGDESMSKSAAATHDQRPCVITEIADIQRAAPSKSERRARESMRR